MCTCTSGYAGADPEELGAVPAGDAVLEKPLGPTMLLARVDAMPHNPGPRRSAPATAPEERPAASCTSELPAKAAEAAVAGGAVGVLHALRGELADPADAVGLLGAIGVDAAGQRRATAGGAAPRADADMVLARWRVAPAVLVAGALPNHGAAAVEARRVDLALVVRRAGHRRRRPPPGRAPPRRPPPRRAARRAAPGRRQRTRRHGRRPSRRGRGRRGCTNQDCSARSRCTRRVRTGRGRRVGGRSGSWQHLS